MAAGKWTVRLTVSLAVAWPLWSYASSLLNTHTLVRGDFTDLRSYSYAPSTRRLTNEVASLDGSHGWTNALSYDGGAASGLGVLTKAGGASSLSSSNSWWPQKLPLRRSGAKQENIEVITAGR